MPVTSRRIDTTRIRVKFGNRQALPRFSGTYAPVVAICLLILAALLAAAAANAQTPEQVKVKNYVSDFANVLSPAARDQINALAAELERKADAQMAVVTIKSLDGRPIEDYSIDLAT